MEKVQVNIFYRKERYMSEIVINAQNLSKNFYNFVQDAHLSRDF